MATSEEIFRDAMALPGRSPRTLGAINREFGTGHFSGNHDRTALRSAAANRAGGVGRS